MLKSLDSVPERQETAIDKLDEFLDNVEMSKFLLTISPAGFCYIFDRLGNDVLMRVTTDYTDVQYVIVNKKAGIADVLKLSELLEPYRTGGWFNVSVEDMIYNKDTKEVLYQNEAKQYRTLLSLRKPEKEEEIN